MKPKKIDTQKVIEAWLDAGGNVSQTARIIGVSRVTIYKHLARRQMSKAGLINWPEVIAASKKSKTKPKKEV